MTESIIVAIITGVSAIVGEIIITNSARKKSAVEDAVKQKDIEDRLKNIEAKLDIHNGYAAKFGSIQTDIAVIKNEIKNLKE